MTFFKTAEDRITFADDHAIAVIHDVQNNVMVAIVNLEQISEFKQCLDGYCSYDCKKVSANEVINEFGAELSLGMTIAPNMIRVEFFDKEFIKSSEDFLNSILRDFPGTKI